MIYLGETEKKSRFLKQWIKIYDMIERHWLILGLVIREDLSEDIWADAQMTRKIIHEKQGRINNRQMKQLIDPRLGWAWYV